MYNKFITMCVYLSWQETFILLIAGATDVKCFPSNSYFVDILWNTKTYLVNIFSIFVYNWYVFISCVAVLIVRFHPFNLNGCYTCNMLCRLDLVCLKFHLNIVDITIY